eukprot:SAG11_NODE_59_length_19156_cov_11.188750_12_plen_74_part_00
MAFALTYHGGNCKQLGPIFSANIHYSDLWVSNEMSLSTAANKVLVLDYRISNELTEYVRDFRDDPFTSASAFP